MKVIRYLGLSLILTFFVSCVATTKGYEQLLKAWVGVPESHLIEKWGVPDSVYSTGGYKFLSYTDSRSGYVAGTSPSYTTSLIGNTAYTTASGGTSGYSYTNICKTTFKLSQLEKDPKIVSWSWEGKCKHAGK